jgi:predicted RNA-binding protein YlxR (DUF448 family)
VIPMRSCVGCGARGAQAELIRVTWREDVLVRDDARRGPGRGAYLHRRPSCWDAFVARRGAVRSLRAAVPRPAREALVRALQAAIPGSGA